MRKENLNILKLPVSVGEDNEGCYLVGADGLVIACAPFSVYSKTKISVTRDRRNFKLIANCLNGRVHTKKEKQL